MKQWCEAVKLAEGTMRELLTECKTFGLLKQGEEKEPINITPEEESSDMSEALTPEQFSQSVPTARGEKALRKAEDETVKQVKLGAANGETYSEKEIKKMTSKFIDIHIRVKELWLLPVSNYSLKNIAQWLNFKWTHDGAEGPLALLWWRQWQSSNKIKQRKVENLERIFTYNKDDCLATWKIAEWLFQNNSLDI